MQHAGHDVSPVQGLVSVSCIAAMLHVVACFSTNGRAAYCLPALRRMAVAIWVTCCEALRLFSLGPYRARTIALSNGESAAGAAAPCGRPSNRDRIEPRFFAPASCLMS